MVLLGWEGWTRGFMAWCIPFPVPAESREKADLRGFQKRPSPPFEFHSGSNYELQVRAGPQPGSTFQRHLERMSEPVVFHTQPEGRCETGVGGWIDTTPCTRSCSRAATPSLAGGYPLSPAPARCHSIAFLGPPACQALHWVLGTSRQGL